MVTIRQTDLQSYIRSIPDFPKKGVVFRDITTLLMDKDAFRAAIELFRRKYANSGITKIVSVESRGFIFGSALAYAIDAGFVPVRKPKKLPAETNKWRPRRKSAECASSAPALDRRKLACASCLIVRWLQEGVKPHFAAERTWS